MTTPASEATLAEFIAARYDEAEAKARAAQNCFPGPWDQADNTDSPLPGAVTLYDSRDESVGVIRGSYAAGYIAAVNPAHRLADIALKRAILAEHTPTEHAGGVTVCAKCYVVDDEAGWCDYHGPAREHAEQWPCTTVRQFGTEFSSHPAYKATWKP